MIIKTVHLSHTFFSAHILKMDAYYEQLCMHRMSLCFHALKMLAYFKYHADGAQYSMVIIIMDAGF